VAHEPGLLILDEPFSGLDPINTKVIEGLIRELKEQGTTIIFSTHRMEQVEELCENIALINDGRVVLEDNITTVRKKYQKNIYHLNFIGDAGFLDQVAGLEVLERRPHETIVRIPDGKVPDTLRSIADSGVELLKFELHLPRLNEIFIEVVNNSKVHA
jgi:ABC-2 type transport system ATP-binding protein